MSNARLLLRQHSQGVLATLGQPPVESFPFTSVVPYCLDGAGRPVLLISDLAQHTKNIQANSHVSLFVHSQTPDPQAAPRLSLIGDLVRIPEVEVAAIAVRYYRYFPGTRNFHRQYDFSFWRLEPVKVHFVAGFARVQWLEPREITGINPFFPEAETDIITHMNDDHAETLILYLRQAGETVSDAVEMVGLDQDLFYLRTSGRIIAIPFPNSVGTPAQVREALIDLLRDARKGDPDL